MSARAARRGRRIGAASAAWLLLVSGWGCGPETRPPGTRASRVIAFEGLELVSQSAAGARVSVSMGSAELRKRRYGVFAVRHLREALAEQVHVRVERPPGAGTDEQGGRRAGATGIELLSPGCFGIVTRMLVRGLDLELGRGETVDFRISAERAGVERGSHLELRDLELRARDGTLLRARAARLEDWERLEIRGGYALERGGATERGTRASFVLAGGGDVRAPLGR